MTKSLAAVLVLAITVTASAQKFGEAVQVTVVEVPVTVVDKAGNPIRNLTKDDFELLDDGKRIPIDYFDVVDVARLSAEGATSATPLPAVATRHFLLLFDLVNSSPGTIGRARHAAREFVNAQMGAGDLAAVATFSSDGGAQMLTSFTRNRTLLANAIETLGHPKYFTITDPLRISGVRVEQVGTDGGVNSGGSAAKAGLEAAIAEMAEEQNRVAQHLADTEARNRINIQLTNFSGLARVLDRMPGQKQIILLSEGFDARIVQGREDLSREATRVETEQVLSGEAYKVNSDNRFGSASASRDVAEMGEIFRRSDVVLHAIDIKGLRGNHVDAEGSRGRSNEALFLLTKPTGGTVFRNENDLSANMASLLEQQEVVYVLGFNARPGGKPGRFHDLRVRTTTGRVSHRPGYYEASGKVTELEKTLTLAGIMTNDTPVNDVELTLAATPLPGPGGKSRVPVVVEIPGPKLLEGVTGNAATATLYLYAFDGKNEVADFLQQRVSLDLAKAGEAVRGSGVRYFGTLRVPAGNYAVKALVRVEETSRAGFLRSDLTVPAFDAPAVLPPVGFIGPANWVILTGPSRGDDYEYPFAAGDARFVPQRPATVTNDAAYTVALFLVRVPVEGLQVTPLLITDRGARLAPDIRLLGRTSPDEGGAFKLVFTFKPSGLAAGEHLLRFTVTAKDGTESVVTLPIRVL